MKQALSLLVGTKDGLLRFQSEDDGESWRHTTDVQTNRSVQLVASDPFDISRAYGVSYSGLVFVTQDGGLTWREMPPKLGCKIVHSIHLMNYKNARLLLGTAPSRLVMWKDSTWKPVTALSRFIKQRKWRSHRGNAKITSILDNPANRKELYVGIEVGGVVKSYDQGDSWDEVSEGINRDVHNMIFGSSSSTIYASTEKGVYMSDNGGGKWYFRSDGLYLRYTTALARYHNKDILFAAGAKEPFGRQMQAGSSNSFSLFRSENGGDSWTNVTKVNGIKLQRGIGSKSLIADNIKPYGIYFSTYDGKIYQSLDDGETFTRILDKLPLTYSLAIRRIQTLTFN